MDKSDALRLLYLDKEMEAGMLKVMQQQATALQRFAALVARYRAELPPAFLREWEEPAAAEPG